MITPEQQTYAVEQITQALTDEQVSRLRWAYAAEMYDAESANSKTGWMQLFMDGVKAISEMTKGELATWVTEFCEAEEEPLPTHLEELENLICVIEDKWGISR